MEYTKVSFTIKPLTQTAQEILIAELSTFPFDSFEETESGVNAYIPTSHISEVVYDDIYILKNPDYKITYASENIPDQNWNEVWEKNFFEPIVIENKCIVRSPFHSVKGSYIHEILIDPKMAFGTGHHETTGLMMRYILESDMSDKKVLDMGCGTSLLAILAEQCGATKIEAIDIDEWAYKNSLENIELNNNKHINVKQGDASDIHGLFDIILANINRNILLTDMKTYVERLKSNGYLVMSGFLIEDMEVIKQEAEKLNLQFMSSKIKNKWMAAEFKKA